MIKVLLIQDKANLSRIKNLIKSHIPSVDIIGIVSSINKGKKYIDNYKPDLVFLDAVLNDEFTFQLVEEVAYKNFKTIFTYYTPEYATAAFKYNPLYYLIKPINEIHFEKALRMYFKTSSLTNNAPVIFYKDKKSCYNFACYDLEGNFFEISLKNIMLLEQDYITTSITLTTGKKISIDMPLLFIEAFLPEKYFTRINEKSIINLNTISRIKETSETSPSQVIMENGHRIRISNQRKNIIINNLENLVLHA